MGRSRSTSRRRGQSSTSRANARWGWTGTASNCTSCRRSIPSRGPSPRSACGCPPAFARSPGSRKDVADAKKYTAADVDAVRLHQGRPQTGAQRPRRAELGLGRLARRPARRSFCAALTSKGARSGDRRRLADPGRRLSFRGPRRRKRPADQRPGSRDWPKAPTVSRSRFGSNWRSRRSVHNSRSSRHCSCCFRNSALSCPASSAFRSAKGPCAQSRFQWPDWKKQGWTIDDVSENAELVENDAEGPGRPKRAAIPAFRPSWEATSSFRFAPCGRFPARGRHFV